MNTDKIDSEKFPIVIRAGKRALEHIRINGLSDDDIDMFAGASGGPKGLVLAGFDEIIFGEWFKNRKRALNMIGSSIGSFRLAAISQKNPSERIKIFYNRYISQQYTAKPDSAEVSDEALAILKYYLDNNSIDYILSHPFMRLHIIAARCRGLGGSDHKIALAPFFAAAYTMNMLNRSNLKLFFERFIFRDCRSSILEHQFNDINTKMVNLNKQNLFDSLMASGAIPFAMKHVTDIEGAHGVFRDGGLIDYHFDLPFNHISEKLVLYPHFFDSLCPGWLDKKIKSRKPSADNYSNVIMIAPNENFIKSLPGGKIPDRNDFILYKNCPEKRVERWEQVVKRSFELADAFMHLTKTGEIANAATPIEGIL
ncbi:MAG: patatin-like phospholipase family protein [Spirochaetes bacterium]|nr:patatin-like phospholipase family protein [Spirochaetota bacterium]MBN2771991.1 patatin-like phospholipase family protein [Spirochaetota bacterium]